MRSKIIGTGSYLPPDIWTNEDLIPFYPTSDDERAQKGYIEKRSGIKERRHAGFENNYASDLGVKAAEKAIENAGIDKKDIDLVLFTTQTPDFDFPGTGCVFHKKFGLPSGVPAIDIRQSCNGFMVALWMADKFIKSGEYRKILIVSAESHFREVRRRTNGKDITILFGDGAGAAVLDSRHSPGIITTSVHTDGDHYTELMREFGSPRPHMNGGLVFKDAVAKMVDVISEVRDVVKIEEIDFFVFHQANLRINNKVAEVLGIPPEKVMNTIQKYANTNSASIPIGLDEAVKAGKIKPGMTVALAAFGAGFTWSGALISW